MGHTPGSSPWPNDDEPVSGEVAYPENLTLSDHTDRWVPLLSVAGATAVPTAQHDEAAARDVAGTWFARLTVAPTLVATSFLLASFPLLLIGWFRPVPVL